MHGLDVSSHVSLPIVKILQEVPRYVTTARAVADDNGTLTCTTAFSTGSTWGGRTFTKHLSSINPARPHEENMGSGGSSKGQVGSVGSSKGQTDNLSSLPTSAFGRFDLPQCQIS